jgi:methionine synthase I (cobalamin-dependent)
MADYTEKFVQLGLNLIGGCCGTTPSHIKAMSAKIKN